MLALIPLALSVLPGLIDLLAGDKAGKVAGSIASAVAAATGTTDPVAAQAALNDPAKAADLRAKLADIALEARRLELADVQSARQMGSTVPLVAKTQVAGFAAVFLIWAGMIGRLNIWGLPYGADATLFVTILSAVSGIFGGMIQFFYGNSTASHAANQRLDKIADQMAVSPGSQSPPIATTGDVLVTNSPQGASEPLSFVRQPSPPGTTADDLNGQELGEPPRVRVKAGSSASSAPTSRFDACLPFILKEEAGFVNDPDDPGGATNMGITHKTLADWRGHAVTEADVRALTVEEAAEIYKANYFLRNRCDQMAPGVDLAVFDFSVPSGGAIKAIQRAFGLKADGAVGPLTLAALASTPPDQMVNRITQIRLAYMRGLSGWPKFGRGWSARVERVRAKAVEMAGG